ncbi:MAG: hypothetical protein CVV64_04370 [Candidatus Wallbacteria bacterium HGW-Wallbacteria-1]|jgi:hypothetical protein|uniref:Uncharacterized protein n=1 Tax=Candidatus Wallbacteria bacterium HGW-Wallbacteria-1 TaxID=2013854 RepID=A0A2N1PRW9_9BACT|nr:MAG: hypothetical protein CVV64_04370 [Candidatus Wallbacteria bacterium HGW-Wallbacteria-1]
MELLFPLKDISEVTLKKIQKTNCWVTGFACLLMGLLFLLALSGTPSLKTSWALEPSLPERINTLKVAEERVSLLNLINGLNLEPAQLSGLRDLSFKADRIRDEAADKSTELITELTETLNSLSASLIKNGPDAVELATRASEQKHRLREIRENLDQELVNMESLAIRILTPSQLEVMDSFKPCIVPPLDFREPVRVGSTPSKAGQEYLKRIREMKDKQYQKRKDLIVEKYISRIEKRHGVLTEEERKIQKQKAIRAMEGVRGMDEAEYRLNVPEILENLEPPQIRDETTLREVRKKVNSRKKHLSQVGRWFLSTNSSQILAALCGKKY